MQKHRIIFLAACLLFSLFVNAQYTIRGVIRDSASQEPLAGASVFCQNTTLGTTTNREGQFSLELKSGGYDLIFSYTGYVTQQIRIHENTGRLEILMVKEEKDLGEVVIKSSNEVKNGWEKYGNFFLDNFIGSTPYAKQTDLKNPEALHFYLLKKSNKLRVLATDPLIIENRALGYNLRYQLDSFIYNYNTDITTYRGYCFYSEMEGSDSIKHIWGANRANAYYGSKLQFMRSYYDSTLAEDGWMISMLDENDDKKFNPISNYYDTTYYGPVDSTTDIEIWYPAKINISYLKKRPEPEYLRKYNLPKNVLIQLSYIDIPNPIIIKQNGYYYDQKDWVAQGYMSWKNLADQLPYDYLPDR